MSSTPRFLPPEVDLETKTVLRKAASAHRYLAELKGISSSIPNQSILINTLSLQEAKDSSEIENIITTADDLYREELFPQFAENASAKEVKNYASALKAGFKLVRDNSLLTSNIIIEIHSKLENHRSGFRTMPGTELKNEQTGETVYRPPQNPQNIADLMSNLELFINDDHIYDADILVKMAIIHFQFESIHPFYDGNGRTGRIINVLFLVLKHLLDSPVLYLSRYIVKHKSDYYRLLQKVREEEAWEEWILFMLDAVESTSRQTISIVESIKSSLLDYKHLIRAKHKFYSQDLINNLFYHPYTKIDFLMRDLNIGRLTAIKYLEALTEDGLLQKEKVGRSNYYINKALYEILTTAE
ncbi:MAG: Fic/DOC family N-terminal domain-containing protein [Candidatus Cloacimonadaceae bacterium]|jgi:Fic family protein|nr:Fic family protein [Candidatus Cloacimonadota bacterium]MDX9950286.1 Fic/DOC family N-terminal domain-containing protein [Candidatus Syntrophosphaera sp.]NLN85974.1 Fic family protein [Candidatus Cloacimonadota bacterium]